MLLLLSAVLLLLGLAGVSAGRVRREQDCDQVAAAFKGCTDRWGEASWVAQDHAR
jgi:hypothetical protein